MNDDIGTTAPTLKERKRVVQVSWHSGNETFDLAHIEDALRERVSRRIISHEIRYKEDLTVRYEAILTVPDDNSNDSFSLTYEQPGTWSAGDAAGQPADGVIGTATYKLNMKDGAIADLKCAWTPSGNTQIVATPSCIIVDFEKARAYETYIRAVRERKFRALILGAEPCCVITGETEISVLDAAHIHEIKNGGTDAADNGIVLRKDLHALFDAHILRIDEHGVFTILKPLKLYQELFRNPCGLTAEKTKTLLTNIKARNAELPDW